MLQGLRAPPIAVPGLLDRLAELPDLAHAGLRVRLRPEALLERLPHGFVMGPSVG